MVRGLLLWAAGNPRLERTITENPILSRRRTALSRGSGSTRRWRRLRS